jgi:hypothetical protein
MSPEAERHLSEWKDLISGLSLLYLGPNGEADALTTRALVHMELNQVGGMEHVSALLMNQLLVKGKEVPAFAQANWGRLSREFHEKYCLEDDCVERRNT